MGGLGAFWRWWTDTWRAPRRARLLYVAMTLAFGALAVGGIVSGDAVVAVIAAIVALATAGLAAVAPKLATWTNPKSG